jgi:undecaprenyl-diphosphatase
MEAIAFFDAALIGFSQALAIAPGISRSGITIAIALLLGVERKGAGRFSFLIFVPAIIGAAFVNFELPQSYALTYVSTIAVATITAALTGYFALALLLRFVQQGKLYMFAPYCYMIGLVALLLGLLR